MDTGIVVPGDPIISEYNEPQIYSDVNSNSAKDTEDNTNNESGNDAGYSAIVTPGQAGGYEEYESADGKKVDLSDPSIKLTRVMRIGAYKPQKYTTSPPPLPEGHVLDKKAWEQLLQDSSVAQRTVSGKEIPPNENTDGEYIREIVARRHAELEARRQEAEPTTFWARMRQRAGFVVSDLSYCANKLYAYAKDEAKLETLQQGVIRYQGLKLTPKELEATGDFLTAFYCRAVIEAPGKNKSGVTAEGWLFITEKLAIFDGEQVALPGATIEGSRRHRFSFQLTKIASFTGAIWKTSTIGTAAGEVPTFMYSQRRKNQVIGVETEQDQTGPDPDEDAVLVFDHEGFVHQFWNFKSYFGSAYNVMCVLNSAWRAAMLK